MCHIRSGADLEVVKDAGPGLGVALDARVVARVPRGVVHDTPGSGGRRSMVPREKVTVGGTSWVSAGASKFL